jgi:membrane associated rhomboid family serine protease
MHERDREQKPAPQHAADEKRFAPVVVWSGGSDSECAELSLVLAAAAIPHERLTGPGFARLLAVPAADAARAAHEIAAYRKERERPVRAPTAAPADFDGAWIGVIGYAALLMLIAVCASQSFLGFDWLVAGVLEAGPALHGEPWRLVTALTLHADAGHLAGNLAFGAFFGYFTSKHFGFGVAWLAILAGGVLGNLLNSVIQPDFHRSIGASTAVFAALGLLTAYAWRRGIAQTSWRARIAPIAAGVGLLAFTGTAGENTDLLAHLLGFAAGFGLGALLARHRVPRSSLLQAVCATAGVLLVLGAWAWALAAAG